MANVAKTPLEEKPDPIAVFSFAGSLIIPTEGGSYWANAVGGVIESQPTGNPFILFSLRYVWNMAGEVAELPEPIRIRLNTALAVTKTDDFKFPALEVPAEESTDASMVEDDFVEEDDVDGIDEEDGEDEIGEDDEIGDELSEALRSDGENEISW